MSQNVKRILFIALCFIVWVFFLTLSPEAIVNVVLSVIAGLQLGKWVAYLTEYLFND